MVYPDNELFFKKVFLNKIYFFKKRTFAVLSCDSSFIRILSSIMHLVQGYWGRGEIFLGGSVASHIHNMWRNRIQMVQELCKCKFLKNRLTIMLRWLRMRANLESNGSKKKCYAKCTAAPENVDCISNRHQAVKGAGMQYHCSLFITQSVKP